MILNINTDATVKFTATLEKLHRSALPNAIRNSLNSAAFDVKQNTMLKSADDSFIKRQPNFFKANSRVDMAKGFDIKSMKSTVGFIENGLKGGNNHAVKDLEQQEHGGKIDKKSFIPLPDARRGNSSNSLVRSNARLSSINKLIDVRNKIGKNKKESFTKTAITAGKGGHILSDKILWKINSIKRLKSGNTIVKKTALYSFKKGRQVSVEKTDFMRDASILSGRKIEDHYIREAQKQIAKYK